MDKTHISTKNAYIITNQWRRASYSMHCNSIHLTLRVTMLFSSRTVTFYVFTINTPSRRYVLFLHFHIDLPNDFPKFLSPDALNHVPVESKIVNAIKRHPDESINAVIQSSLSCKRHSQTQWVPAVSGFNQHSSISVVKTQTSPSLCAYMWQHHGMDFLFNSVACRSLIPSKLEWLSVTNWQLGLVWNYILSQIRSIAWMFLPKASF